MTAGFKFQLVSCRSPQEVLTVTLTHLVTVKSYLTDPLIISLVDNFENALRSHFGSFTLGEWYALRQALHRFLSDKHVKVSLFLQEGIQHSDGRIKLPGSAVGDGAVGPVGTVRRYDGGGDATGKVQVSFGVKSTPPHPVPLGGNMYARDRQAAPPAPLNHHPRENVGNGHANGGGGGGGGGDGGSGGGGGGARVGPPEAAKEIITKGNAEEIMENAGKDAANELNALAGLIRPSAPVDTFKLNLFGEGSGASSGGGGGGGGGGGVSTSSSKGASSMVIQFDGDAGNKASGLADIMGSFSVDDKKGGAGGGKGEEEEDDLLALMDAA